tara:strand:- start:16986 stop:17168 length:183 start_codon:yes stop_codon:yes gene_type:complete
MSDYLEIDEKKRSFEELNLEDLSIEELKEYICELEKEISRTKDEINNKKKTIEDAEKFFS